MESLTIADLKAEQKSILENIELNMYFVKEISDSSKLFSKSQKDKERICTVVQKYMDEIWILTKRNTEISKQLKLL